MFDQSFFYRSFEIRKPPVEKYVILSSDNADSLKSKHSMFELETWLPFELQDEKHLFVEALNNNLDTCSL